MDFAAIAVLRRVCTDHLDGLRFFTNRVKTTEKFPVRAMALV